METATMTASSTLHIEIESLPIDRSAGFHQKVLDGIEDLLLVLDQGGRVLYASPKSYPLIQVKPETLVGRYISTCMNVDDIPIFLIDFKENMATGACWRSHHRLRRGDDTYKPFESTFKPYTDVIVDDKTGSKISTKMCLMIARPYQITSTSLMDSFLEHYTTNIRLSNQIARLRGEAEEFDRSSVVTPTAVITQSIEVSISGESTPARSISGSTTSRKRTLSTSTTSTKPQVDSVMGDMGIEIIPSRLQTMAETGAWTAKPRTKKRKSELSEEFLCKECGTTDSPEWRKGPLGFKTLCNACGLRWSKTQKKPSSSQNEIELSQ